MNDIEQNNQEDKPFNLYTQRDVLGQEKPIINGATSSKIRPGIIFIVLGVAVAGALFYWLLYR